MSLVLVRDEGRVRILTLNRPASRNALNAELRLHLIAALRDAEADPSVGAIVLTGAGTAFAAGADLGELASRSPAEQRAFLQPPHIYSVAEGLAKPVIAAINGHALGAGLELATACDVRVASADAKLGQPEVLLALIPGGGGTQRLVRLVGHGAASRLVLTGDPISAPDALACGLVDAVVPAGETVTQAVALAQRMARHDPGAIAAAKRALAAARNEPYRVGLATEVAAFMSVFTAPASQKAVAGARARTGIPPREAP